MNSFENTEILWNQFRSGLKLFILSKVKNEDDADDIMQNVFLKIHDNIHSLKDKSRIKPWIYQVTRNLIIDYFRISNRSRKFNKLKVEPAIDSSTNKYMDVAISDMIQMMNELSTEYCEVLCMTELETMTLKQYAEKKGLSYSGAKSRVQRARNMLKDMLLKCCHYQFDKYGTVYDIQPKCCCCTP